MSLSRHILIAFFSGTAAGLLSFAVISQAKDLGVAGQTFEIIEPDLLSMIETRLKEMQASGELAQRNEELKQKVVASVERPTAVTGLRPTDSPRTWLHDPSIIVSEDITLPTGDVLARAGDRINPLEMMPLTLKLILIDGDDPKQVEFALKETKHETRTRRILVSGAPLELMRATEKRFYFDQDGQITSKFGITQVPAIIVQEGNRLRISEIDVRKHLAALARAERGRP